LKTVLFCRAYDTSIVPTWQRRLQGLLREHKFTYLLTYLLDAAFVTDVTQHDLCVYLCLSHLCTLQKQLNRSRCHLGADSYGPREPCFSWGSTSHTGRR